MQSNIKSSIVKGDFPLNHDSVLIVRQVNGTQYFTGKLDELSDKVHTIMQLIAVKSVEIVSVENFS